MAEPNEAPEEELQNWTIPNGYEWYELQIAGHHHEKVKNGVRQVGLLRNNETGRLLKPVQPGIRGVCEASLYNSVFIVNRKKTNEKDDRPAISDEPILSELAELIPTYFGSRMVSLGREAQLFLELEDVTAAFRCPCVIDLKIGAQTWEPSASAAKMAHERQKYPHGHKIGFRILGMKRRSYDRFRSRGICGWQA